MKIFKTQAITAWDIIATENIRAAGDISAGDIIAENITAENISYYAFCCVYDSIKCCSIKAIKPKSYPPICLDGRLEENGTV